ncbi:MBL fold metallo-hydrolase [Fibrisoma montanum]|uniref:MBL fold metallo-hydrolase n=2 Tax=Fibrisoma montanum TaxID=2305895 RepID=A0A418MB13_9BACT|nr:MBL fold metallo-hydrolase [Fibrisoma montanum]
MRLLRRSMYVFLGLIAVLAVVTVLVLQLATFGATPAGDRLTRIGRSANYRDGHFRYPIETSMMAPGVSYWQLLMKYLRPVANREPTKPLPSVKTDLSRLEADSAGANPVLVWFGHSSYLIKVAGQTILVDPVFSDRPSPISVLGTKSYPGSNVYTVDDLPAIDVVVITHDHYDHLDYDTILKLIPKARQFHTALGVGAHLARWGVPESAIHEYDWGEGGPAGRGLTLRAVMARHFSGRGLVNGKTLWTAFVLQAPSHTLFLGGDSGYGPHFKEIGDQYGPFDLALLEAGQYDVQWPFIHMMPEETVQAAVDLRANVLMPVHWGKFTLALHPWTEPVERVLKKAGELNVTVTTPMIGEPVVVGKTYPQKRWWGF